MPENEVANNAALRQFEIREGDQVARLTYNDILSTRSLPPAPTTDGFAQLTHVQSHLQY